MSSSIPKSGTGGVVVGCDFCGSERAVLYCRADSAKLCLVCDQHVHSANLLSRKHLRSLICDNCSAHPVSLRCNTLNLLLCHHCHCDPDSPNHHHHHHTPVDGFTGCPSSSADLASIFGDDYPDLESWVQDLMVPNPISPLLNNHTGKHKQLLELLERDLALPAGTNEADDNTSSLTNPSAQPIQVSNIFNFSFQLLSLFPFLVKPIIITLQIVLSFCGV